MTASDRMIASSTSKARMAGAGLRFCNSYPERYTLDHIALIVHKTLITYTFLDSATNASVVRVDDVPDCLKMLKDNETDIFMNRLRYPYISTELGRFFVFGETFTQLLSSYQPVTDQYVHHSCMSNFNNISIGSVLCLIAFLLMFCLLFHARFHMFRVMKKRKKNRKGKDRQLVFQPVIALLLNQASACAGMERKTASFRHLVFVLTVFMFLIHFYFTAYIKTQQVATKKPHIIDSYDKVLEPPNMRPIWIPNEVTYLEFMESPPGSREHMIWERARKMSPACHESVKGCFFEADESSGVLLLNLLSERRAVLISDDITGNGMHAGLCPLSRMMEKNPLTLTRDPDSPEELVAFTHNPHLAKKPKDFFNRRSNQALEFGLNKEMLRVKRSPLENTVAPEVVRTCLKHEIITSDPEVQQKTLSHFAELFKMWAILLLVTCTGTHVLSLIYFRLSTR